MKSLVVAALAVLASTAAHAQDYREPDPALPPPRHAHSDSRFELAMGFLAGDRTLPSGTFAAQDLAGAISAPYAALDSTPVLSYGPRVEWRAVFEHVRTSLALQWPHPAFGSGQLTLRPLDGEGPVLSTRSISVKELRLGIGAETTVWKLRPFADLVGDMQWVEASVVEGNALATYSACRFAYAVSGGVAVRLEDHMFVAAAGEVGLTGAMRWGAQLMVGGSIDFCDQAGRGHD